MFNDKFFKKFLPRLLVYGFDSHGGKVNSKSCMVEQVTWGKTSFKFSVDTSS